MSFSRIIATGSYLPQKSMTNTELESMVETSDEWIKSRTGIENRHIITENETTLSMAKASSERALEMAGLSAEDIDLIICATCTAELLFPSTACMLQKELGINKNLIAFDVTAACAGFMHGLGIADQFIRSGKIKRALIVGSESLSRVIDWNDRNTCVLFGDGAGAFILEASEEPGIRSINLNAQGRHHDILYLMNRSYVEDPYVHMKGKEVFKLAVSELQQSAETILAENKMTADEIDWLIPHQANARIIEAIAKKINLPKEKVVMTLHTHGNTSSASIPLAMDAAVRDGRIQAGHSLLLQAIGGGMAWGSALVTY